MSVVRPQLAAGLHLAHTGSDQGAADVFGDEGLLHPPALAVARLVPLIAVQVEALHRAEPTGGAASLRHNQRVELRPYSEDDLALTEALETDPETMRELGGAVPPEELPTAHGSRVSS